MKRIILTVCILLTPLYAVAEGDGKRVYNQICSGCHAQGVLGAPRIGDVRDWTSRVSKGQSVLEYNAIEGYAGKTGFMPPRGGDPSLTDNEIKSAIQYMINKSW